MFKLLSPAKINLFLHVVGHRHDGYHQLRTVFQFLDCSDTLTFQTRTDGRIRCFIEPTTVQLKTNSVIHAACRLQQYTQTDLGADIWLNKHLYIGAGLGGGSSNAATTLVALNALWQTGLSDEALHHVGLQLGADVPIFLYGRSAWAQGIGDELTPCQLDTPWYLIVHPGCQVSTRTIFKNKLPVNPHPFNTPTAYQSSKATNDCEPAVCARYPQIGQALRWLRQFAPARLTGTGSCMFAPFSSHEAAEQIKQKLPCPLTGFIAKGINQSPLYEQLKRTTIK